MQRGIIEKRYEKTEEETIAVKCHNCNREMRAGEPCPECGKKAASDDIRVEYKDFKGAELLDIQMRQTPGNRPPGSEKEKPKPLQKKTITSRPAAPYRGKTPPNKMLLIVLAVVMTALTCYLLLKIFLWQ